MPSTECEIERHCGRCGMPVGTPAGEMCAEIERLRAALSEIAEWTDKSPQGDWMAHQLLKDINDTAHETLGNHQAN